MPPEFGISEEKFVLGGHIVAEIAKFLDDYARAFWGQCRQRTVYCTEV